MTQNVNIRFVGSADFGQVNKELAQATSQFTQLSAAMKAAATNKNGTVNVKWLDELNKQVDMNRHLLTSSINAMDDFGARSVTVADHVDTLTEKIKKQKFGISDLVREHKNLRDVYRQQRANRDSMVLEWGTNGDGSINADVITRNRNAEEYGRSIKNWRQELGMYNQVLNSVADQTVKWGKNTQWAGRQLMAGITYPVAAAGAATAALAYQVDKGLTQVVKVYGDATTALTTSDAEIKNATMQTARSLASGLGQSVNDTLDITAQLAAVGNTGVELQKNTAAVSRARLLGELSVQDAMSATVTLQSVYNMSSKELADTFNYMNSMENQTVLTMQDFVVGIPKVSGVIKELGGDVREVGTLLAAMKIAGIDAAEGANAIKSIAFKTAAQNNGAKDMFQSLVGQSYEEVVGETTDVTKRLVLIGQAMKNAQLTATERVGLIAKMFGLYQGSKALSIISQLTDGSEQMSRALDVSAQSTEEWAATAGREIDKLTNSNWNKLQQRWQTLKIDLAEVGESFLALAVPVMDLIGNLVSGFNNLDDGAKKWIVRLLAVGAAIGPLIMLAGLMGNLIGNLGKFASFITRLIAPFKMLTAEEVAQERLSRIARKSTSDSAAAYANLALQIQKATESLGVFTAQQLAAQGKNPAAYGLGMQTAATNGKGRRGNRRSDSPVTTIGANAAEATAEAGAAAEKANRSFSRLGMTAAAFGTIAVTGMAAAATESGSLMSNLADTAFIMASVAPLLSGTRIASRIGEMAKSTGTWARELLNVSERMGTIKGRVAGMSGELASAAKGFGAIGLAAAAAVYLINKNYQSSSEEVKNFGDSAQSYAKVLGFSYTKFGEKVDEAGNKVATLNDKVSAFASENPDAAKILRSYMGLNDEAQAQEAIGEGIKAVLHGATKEQALEAAQIAYRTMNKTLSDEQITANITAKIDFGNMDQVIEQKIADIQNKVSKAASNTLSQSAAETFYRGVDNIFLGKPQEDINSAGKEQIKQQARDMIGILNSASDEALPGIIDSMKEAAKKSDDALFNSMFSPEMKKKLAAKGVTSMQDINNQISKGINDVSDEAKYNPWAKADPLGDLGFTEEQKKRFEAYSNGRSELVSQMVEQDLTLNDSQKANIVTMDDYLKATGRYTEVMNKRKAGAAQWKDWLARMEAAGGKFTDKDKLMRLNLLRTAAGLEEATSYAQGFGNSLSTGQARILSWTSAIKAMGGAAVASGSLISQLSGNSMDLATSDSAMLSDSYKSTYSGAMDNIYSTAAAIASEQISDMNESIADSFDNARKRLEGEQKAAEKGFEGRSKAFENRWETRMDAFQKKWENRKDATEAKYDSQIEKIKAQIKAEEDAEAIRQRIFEAEKTRLSRLAEMKNRNIDFNMALNSGNLDEAAKISNDVAATQQSWIVEDAQAASGDASGKKTDAMQTKIDKLEKEKDARLKALDEVEAREKKQLEARKEREQELLQAQREAMQASFDAKKANLDRQEKAEQKSATRSAAREQRLLEQKLAELKAWVPKDEKELAQHTAKVEEIYKAHGGVLLGKSKEWAGIMANSLSSSTKIAATKMSNDIAWAELGRLAAENMTKGAFNMTLSQFIKWVAGGEMPSNAAVGASNKNMRAVKGPNGTTRWVFGSQGGLTRHEGGLIGPGGKNKRTGFSGNTDSNSEVNVRALVGEAVLNRRATKNLGADGIDYLNRWGGIPEGMGFGGPEISTQSAVGFGAIMQGIRRGIVEGGMRKAASAASAGPGMIVGGDSTTAMFPGGWKRPAAGPVTSHFGYRYHPILKTWRLHGGADIGAPSGAPIYAAKGGTVAYAGPHGSHGNFTVVNHGAGVSTGYAHQSVIGTKVGAAVRTGQTIGRVGSTGRSTGPHLHFEYMKNGVRVNPNQIIPGLNTGGYIVKDGLAKLHEDEVALTKPLTRDLETGIQRIAEGDSTTQNHFHFTGPINGIDDLESAMIEVMNKVDERKGNGRRVVAKRR